MVPLKSLGPEGFSACFYQAYWHIVGEEVREVVLKFLNDGAFDINFTYVVLIPKVKTFISQMSIDLFACAM